MIDLRLDANKLVAHAQMQGHNHLHDEDLGYAAHGWLCDALGHQAPTTFRLLESRQNSLRLLGYGPADAKTLREHMQLYASPTAAAVCNWAAAASKPMGDIAWSAGKRLGFEIRLCPVVRGENGERDAFLAQLPPEKEAPAPGSRTGVYREWLARRLDGAARLDEAGFELKAFRLVSLWRQAQPDEREHRVGRRLVRPDALVGGRLTITDQSTFASLLQQGIGRHRAFGFGMLLLRPA